MVEKRGLTKENAKKLFRKPTLNEWVILLMLVFILIAAWAYKHDVEQYRDVIYDLLEQLEECGCNQEIQQPINFTFINENTNRIPLDV